MPTYHSSSSASSQNAVSGSLPKMLEVLNPYVGWVCSENIESVRSNWVHLLTLSPSNDVPMNY